ncbi:MULTISPECIES: diguanylate cyclase [unclassified Deinococcus]|uniref:GGDEF domain-containing protein n=1 Tax=unclassified Deinococcus TaxID=2623546 RepID=UPI001E40E4FD|nr:MULTISPECIES: diguanylate cyclase [unclassified Deinococcus]MCD0155761.1 diguanylate cyclase [Deinococcus sp. 6GRE01]MCD0168899.1 diguanylate cyclase [Deinococcus sp. 23YEL01]MCD0174899.1 diguanylate cyclase [Deinococcus sp. 14RED07]
MVRELFLNTCILVALTYALSLMYREWPPGGNRLPYTRLLAFTAMGAALMSFPAEVSPGVLLDLRAVPVVLVTLRYGPGMGLAVAMPILLIRTWHGGAGVEPAVLALLGVLLMATVARRRGVTLQGLVSTQLWWAPALLLPYPLPLALLPDGAQLFLQSAAPLIAFNAVGLLICTSILVGRFQALGTLQRLTRQAELDALTALPNRRRLDADLARLGTQDALLLIDIDHFKRVNDQYGHSVGDEVLKEVSRCLETQLRARDTAYRYGGEEFAVILRRTDPAFLTQVAERLRQAVESYPVQSLQGRSVTVSVGAAISEGLPDVVQRADAALYEAKEGGRNCARTYSPQVSETVRVAGGA